MNKNKYITIAIDGAAGAGKSTTSKLICEKFKYIHIDTGLHYRSMTLFFSNKNISADSVPSYLKTNSIRLDSSIDQHSLFLKLDDQLFSVDQLRDESMNQLVSYYARLPELRSLLLNYQRSLPEFAKELGFCGVVMDGRDIGSVVLPNADLKYYLHADINIRESRRGDDGEKDSISSRDQLDTTRKSAPLVCPQNAISIDTGITSITDVVESITKDIYSLL